MLRDRKCILCDTVHASKQEMDEHMRSMLHHRELEKLKGRDCGHECRVCKVTVVSLTDYASHISSPLHKQNVEASEQNHAVSDHDKEYFDKSLVDLIEKRKEMIRKENEAAAAAKQAKVEAERKLQELQQRIQEAKERFHLKGVRQQPPKSLIRPNQQGAFCGSGQYSAKGWGAKADRRPWDHGKQGKSATWHAQEPPNFQRWASGELAGASMYSQGSFGNRRVDQDAFFDNQQGRLPWLSNRGRSNGPYSPANISQDLQRNKSLSLLEISPRKPPPSSFYSGSFSYPQNNFNNQSGQQGDGVQNWDGENAEGNQNNMKTFGSNPKLDKTHRWSPYPVTKGFECTHKEFLPTSSEKPTASPKSQMQEKTSGTISFNRPSVSEKKSRNSTHSKESGEELNNHRTKPKATPRDSSGSRSSSVQRDDCHDSSPGPSNRKAKKTLHNDWKVSSAVRVNAGPRVSTTLCQARDQSKAKLKNNGNSFKSLPTGPLPSTHNQQFLEPLKKAKATVLKKEGSVNTSSHNKMKKAWQEESHKDQAGSQIGVNTENGHRQYASKTTFPDSVHYSLCGVEKEKLASTSIDSSHFLQARQVSIPNVESSEPATSSRKTEAKKKVEKESPAADEAMQAGEAGKGSDTDALRNGEVHATSASKTSSVPKVHLTSALKLDLTKHISAKSKAGNHEPNLNIARRVRNLDESRRSETEKDSALKPTVRQLISSSASRRNVNWDQVYQEVKKKQEQGKGMPRFGIEMVPYDKEGQSQEEDDIQLLEGFQWESLDTSLSGSSRKRSLSESSLAPACSASTHSLFPSDTSKETDPKDVPSPSGTLSSEQNRSCFASKHMSAHGNEESQCQQDEEQHCGQQEIKAEKHPDKITLGTAWALQRSDSVVEDSSSGTELYDGQGTGKKRRAAGDVLSTESPCLEHNNKRRKIKSRREHLQIDELLSVSLREEELSRSLQTVDSNLLQARAALEAAYMEVQRLIVVKQQMTGEMSTLRKKRIELLKGMQGNSEEGLQFKVKADKEDSVESAPNMGFLFSSSVMDTVAATSLSQAPQHSSPPSSSLPVMPSAIKQEPRSPVHNSTDLQPVENENHCSHSITPEPTQPGNLDEAPQFKVKYNKEQSAESTPHTGYLFAPSVMDTVPASVLNQTPQRVSPPSSSLPVMPLVIKQEPQSPVHNSTDLQPVENENHCSHSTTPEPTQPGNLEEGPQCDVKGNEDSVESASNVGCLFSSSVMEAVAASNLSQAPQHFSSPFSSLPLMPLAIKQEPQSPVHNSTELQPVENENHCSHSTTPTPTQPDIAHSSQSPPERKPELYQANREHEQESFAEPADCKESLSAVVQMVETAVQASRDTLTPLSDTKIGVTRSTASRRSSEGGSLVDCTASLSCEPSSVPSVFNEPTSPHSMRSGKRVRKLKKRRVLEKTQGPKQPESSDTEIDGEALRPRWARARRRPSCGSQVSTSTPHTAAENQEVDVAMEGDEDASELLHPAITFKKEILESHKGRTALPQVAPTELSNLKSEESMEVTASCQQPLADENVPVPVSSPPQFTDSTKRAPQTLACNEILSNSDMDISLDVKSCESDMQICTTSPERTKASSEAVIDPDEDEAPTEGVFEGHKEAVNSVQIHNGLLYTCSGDRTVKVFDLVSHKCVKVFEGHSSKVNSLLVSAAPGLRHRLYSGSSDQTIRCYSLMTQEFEQQFSLSDRVLCLHSRWKFMYAGLGNGTVVTFNLKNNRQTDTFECHGPRAVSCLASSQEGSRRVLLVGSFDSTISVRDAKNGLLLRTLTGHSKTVLCLKVVNDLVFSGSSDQSVHAHNIHTGKLVQVYKGHSHAVTVVAVLGKVMVTACLDKLVRVYNLQSSEQLQVYGGHTDMVMCMAIHNNMLDIKTTSCVSDLNPHQSTWDPSRPQIYTGCYDGSVQSVKLNLTQNFRCWWRGCSLVFGVMKHLQQHLRNDHASPTFQTEKS